MKKNLAKILIILTCTALPAKANEPAAPKTIKTFECLKIKNTDQNEGMDNAMNESTKNYQVAALSELVKASEYVLRSNKQYYIPKLAVGGSSAYTSTSTSEKLFENGNYVNSYSVPAYFQNTPSAVINQNLLNLAQQSLITSNTFQLESQRSQTLAQAQSNAINAAQLYNSIIQYYNSAVSIKTIIQVYRTQYENTLKLKKAGEASLIDLLSAKSQLELYEQQLLQTKSSMQSAITSLETITNKAVCKLDIGDFIQFPSIKEISLPNETTVNEAISLSPTLNTYQSTKNSSLAQAQYYDRSYLPSFSAQLGYSGTYENGNIPGVGTNNSQYYLGSELYAQISFNWTIYDGGSNQSLAMSQRKTSEYNQKLYEQGATVIANNIKNYYETDQINTSSLVKATSQLKINKSLTDLVSIGYKAGYMTYLNFQVQASALYSSYINLFTTQATLNNNRLAYYSLYLFKEFKKTGNSLQKLLTLN